MGYGLDTTKYVDRKWGQTITWSGETKGKLAEALGKWQDAAGVTFTKTTSNPDFTVKYGYSSWQNNSKGNGKPAAGKNGILNIKTTSSLGSVLHEIGHLLGLSHEQDHPDKRVDWYAHHSTFDWEKEGADTRAAHNKVYDDYEAGSIMHYPKTHYRAMTEPTDGDAETVKAINGW